MSALSEIIDRLERTGQGEAAHALRHVREVAEQRQSDLAAKDDRIREYMDICEDLSRKLEASRHRVAELEAIRDAVKPLVDACVKEFTSKSTEEGEKPCDDDEGVAFDMYPYKCQITFGMIRRARSTLD
ncbi:MAG TPA: hypothetical protein VKA94_00135 [Hyphomicrobiales bacterium]|nr:hypothetical protein [Hyphomicrobiales bacterium]